ncbi:MAG: molecular chaperone HtpG [Candidatus Odinarchaeota archaeon]
MVSNGTSSEASEGETFEFKAEIQRVLDIIINRLYKNREIFLRELLSNSADALSKLRVIQLTSDEKIHKSDKEELSIHISVDEDEKTITVTDNGVGMTRDEIITNLGTIAQSGTLQFLEQLKDLPEDASLIGQFGVGFYSSFIVANKVIVRSKSYQPDSQAVEWHSEGTGKFTVKESNKEHRGTDIILHLKDDAVEDFGKGWRLQSVINRYSDFISFPITLDDNGKLLNDGKPVNKQTPIWRVPEENLEDPDKEYNDFYRQISMDFDEPLHRIKVSADAPLQFKSLLFIPKNRQRSLFLPQSDWGLKLYSKKILVQDKSKDSLPDYLRFIHGVIDSEDLPLNVSREVVQTDRTIRRIRKVLMSKILSELKKIAEGDSEKYLEFWTAFGSFIKEGMSTETKEKEKLVDLLRVQTTKSEDKWIPLSEYSDRMKEDQEKIFYLVRENLETAKHSSHLDYYSANDLEVVFFTEPIDNFMLMHLTEYRNKQLQAIDQEILEPEEEQKKEEKKEEKGGDEEVKKPDDKLITKMKELLGDRVLDVRYSDKLVDNPSRLVGSAGLGFQRVMKYMADDYQAPRRVLEINENHFIIKELKLLVKSGQKADTVETCVIQLFENHLLEEGDLRSPVEMIKRINRLMGLALENIDNKKLIPKD